MGGWTRQSGRKLQSVVCAAVWAAMVMLSAAQAEAATPEEKAAAEAQFDEGVKLLKAGSLDAACKKLESSQRIDPGIGTLLYLGECYEKSGKSASAWATFREAASAAQAAGQSERARVGMQRADRLADKLSKLTVELASENMSIEGLEITSDEQKITRGLWGTALPVDPGEHTIKAMAPGYEPLEVKVTIGPNGQNQTIQLAALKQLPPGAEPPQAEPQGTTVREQTTGPQDAGVSDGKGQRTAGLVIGGIGVLGLAAGGVFGVLAIVDNGKAKEGGCEPGAGACPVGVDGIGAANNARTEAMVSTIGFIAGGALVAAGAVLYFTAPDAPQTAELHVVPMYGGAALSFGGTF